MIKFETQEEKELWKAVLIACLNAETCGYSEAAGSADMAIIDYRKRNVEKLDTGI